MFAGLRSRWTMPAWCAIAMPVAMSQAYWIARGKASGFSFTISAPSVCDGKYSIEMA
jgi:hypothetical protein